MRYGVYTPNSKWVYYLDHYRFRWYHLDESGPREWRFDLPEGDVHSSIVFVPTLFMTLRGLL